MTKEEYREQLQILQAEYDSNRRQLDIMWANERNPIRIGDVIKDHMGRGVVTKIHLYNSVYLMPMCKYWVTIVNKDGSVTKRSEKERYIYQCNVKQINDTPYAYERENLG